MHDKDFYGDKFKWFVGVVKDNDGLNRVRVRVYGIHRMDDITDVSDEDLPWATVLLPATSGETGTTNGSINLNTGDWVVGFFADGDDCQQPVVMGVIGKGKDSDNYSPTGGDDGSYDDGTADDGSGGGGGGGDEDVGGGTPQSDTAIPGNSAAEKIYVALKTEFLKRTGGNEDKAHMLTSAVMGNMEQESGLNFNAQNVNILKRTGRPEASFGLIQWFESRRIKLFKYTFGPDLSALPESARRALLTNSLLPGGKRVVGIPLPGVADQISFFFRELDLDLFPGAYEAFMRQNDLKSATNTLAKRFIIPAVVEASRYQFAQKWHGKFINYRVAPSREL